MSHERNLHAHLGAAPSLKTSKAAKSLTQQQLQVGSTQRGPSDGELLCNLQPVYAEIGERLGLARKRPRSNSSLIAECGNTATARDVTRTVSSAPHGITKNAVIRVAAVAQASLLLQLRMLVALVWLDLVRSAARRQCREAW
jgi:hypothetical protein